MKPTAIRRGFFVGMLLVTAVAAASAEPSSPATEAGAQPARQAGDSATLATQPEALVKAIELYLPDPTRAAEAFAERAARLREKQSRELSQSFDRIVARALKHLEEFQSTRQLHVSLQDCLRRALAHSHGIRVEGYSPAIEAARVVEAEARFDAVFFAAYQENIQERPSSLPQLTGTVNRTRFFQFGINKLLSTGAQVSIAYEFTRTFSNNPFLTLNPSYFSDLFFEIRQPFLRNFGLDVTKAEIQLRKLDQEMAEQRFSRQVQQITNQVEQAYWQLVLARRDLPIAAELLAQTEEVDYFFKNRLGYDAYPIQVAQNTASLRARQADYDAVISRIRDAEGQLKALINDPDMPIPEDVEIVPTDEPRLEIIGLDRLAEIQAAIENRPELREAKYAVDSARVGVTVASNQRLPRLDVTFRYTLDGLGANLDQAFGQMSVNDFAEYLIGVELEWPIGNRGPAAAWRQARLRLAQAIASVKQLLEQVILDVDVAIRRLQTLYKQIPPSADAVLAQAENLTAIQLRSDRKNPTFLDLELRTQEAVAAARRRLLQEWIDYNVSIVDLELAKGTLLTYNNIRFTPRP